MDFVELRSRASPSEGLGDVVHLLEVVLEGFVLEFDNGVSLSIDRAREWWHSPSVFGQINAQLAWAVHPQSRCYASRYDRTYPIPSHEE
ncbi:hypothetical protein Dimus_035537 [Dionaea muscipula]